jgi:hypothetical protein
MRLTKEKEKEKKKEIDYYMSNRSLFYFKACNFFFTSIDEGNMNKDFFFLLKKKLLINTR